MISRVASIAMAPLAPRVHNHEPLVERPAAGDHVDACHLQGAQDAVVEDVVAEQRAQGDLDAVATQVQRLAGGRPAERLMVPPRDHHLRLGRG